MISASVLFSPSPVLLDDASWSCNFIVSFPCLRVAFFLTWTCREIQAYIPSCLLAPLQRCFWSPQSIFLSSSHLLTPSPKPLPLLTPPSQSISQLITPRAASSSVWNLLCLFLLSHPQMQQITRSCGFSYQNACRISQPSYAYLPIPPPVISPVSHLPALQFTLHGVCRIIFLK